MFSNAEWLYDSVSAGVSGPQDGDAEELVHQFNRETQTHFETVEPGASQPRATQFARWLLTEALAFPRIANSMPSELLSRGADALQNAQVDVKSLTRFVGMLVHGLCLQADVHTIDHGGRQVPVHSTQMRIDALVAKGVLSVADGDSLADAFSKLGGIRNTAHLTAGSAHDIVLVGAHESLPGVIRTLADFEKRLVASVPAPAAAPGTHASESRAH